MTTTIRGGDRGADELTDTDELAAYPFPFSRDQYRYSANVQPAARPTATAGGSWGDRVLAVDGSYRGALVERARILGRDPSRSQTLPHMEAAAWDALLWVLTTLAQEYPEHMSLDPEDRHGGWVWRNGLLGVEQRFRMWNPTSLPCPPLEYASRMVQEDLVLLDQRDGQLWVDAGVVTFAADWSFDFDVGMSFTQIHGPVPRIHDEGIVARAQQFIMRLQEDQPYRRTNWTLTVDGRRDQSTETSDEWVRDRAAVADGPVAEVGDRLFLRTEVQHLIRLPRSAAVLFLIGTHLMSLRDITRVPEWGDRLCAVLAELPEDMALYKGIERTREAGVRWLREHGHVDGGPAGVGR